MGGEDLVGDPQEPAEEQAVGATGLTGCVPYPAPAPSLFTTFISKCKEHPGASIVPPTSLVS